MSSDSGASAALKRFDWARWSLRAILALASTILSLLAAELALRALGAAPDTGSLSDLAGRPRPVTGSDASLADLLEVSPSPHRIYQLRPNLDVQFLGARVQTGPRGWRDRDPLRAKIPGERRIVGIGDSVLFGWGVEEGERYLDLLQAGLERTTRTRWTSIALAAPGYNLEMELDALRAEGPSWQPDVLLYGLVDNDMCLPNFVVPPTGLFDQLRLVRLLRGSALPRTLVERGDVLLRPSQAVNLPRANPEFRDAFCSPDNVPAAFRSRVGERSFRRALGEVAEIAVRSEVPLIIVDHTGTDSDLLAEELRGRALVVDMPARLSSYLAAHRELQQSDFELSERDSHPSIRGHQLIADAVLETMVSAGLAR